MQGDQKRSRRVDETHRSILEAAIALFRQYGYRKTSVDQIASAARVAKPTVYAHFAHKEALFAAVCEHVIEGMLESARQAARARGKVVSRVSGVLSAKFTTLFEVVQSSPHAAELLHSQHELAAEAEACADAEYHELLVGVLEGAAATGELDLARLGPSALLARILIQAAYGASYDAKTSAEHRANVKRATRALLLAGL